MKRTEHAVKPIAVFLGPSLGKDQARSLLDAEYYPPARKGDIYLVMASGAKTIVLIDGVFHNTPSVWQRELLEAIEEGIRVLGASSMGALRAAELYKHGMIGHGTIFEWYRDGIIDGDDEVALWHEPEERNFRALSEPLVNIRYTLLRAMEDHCLTPEQAQEMTAYAKEIYYPKRSYRALLKSPILKGWSQDRVANLKQYFSTKAVDLKMLDAIGVLRHCACNGNHQRRQRKSKNVNPSFQADDRWFWNYQRLMMSGFINGCGLVTGEQVLKKAYKDSEVVESMRAILAKHYFLLEWAKQNGLHCPKDFLITFVKEWEDEHRITDRRSWLRANGLTQKRYENLLQERALIHWLTTKGPTDFGLDTSFVLDWARQNGVSLTAGCVDDSVEPTDEAMEDWIVKKGPGYFGLIWSFDVAFLQELQITGKIAGLIKKVDAK